MSSLVSSGARIRAARGKWWFPSLALGLMSVVVLSVLNPPLLLSSTTPTGGDMGAHVLGPAYLRDVLLPQGQILGWSQSWFAGFPAFYFYFPLPSLVIVLLDLILPYGVAFKLVTVMGLVATPPATYYLARSLRLGKSISLVAASAGVVFVFMESFTIYGGNIASTLAGEFSFSWSFALSLVYLGLLIRGVRDDRKYLPWAAVLLGLTALSHIITTIVIVLASVPVLFWKRGTRALAVWAGGFAIAGFWALPLLARIGYTSDMAWSPLTKIEELLPVEIWLLLPLAVVGAILMARRTPRIIPIVAFTLLPVIYFPLPTTLHDQFPGVFTEPRWKLWNGRLLPYWYFGVAFLAAIAVGFVARWLIRQLPERVSIWWTRGLFGLGGIVAMSVAFGNDDAPWWLAPAIGLVVLAMIAISMIWHGPTRTRSVVVAVTAAVLSLGALAGVAFVDGWARWNYEGYEAKGPWLEYEGLMETIATLPPGRVLWEPDSGEGGLDKYGTPMSPMLIPYWAGQDYPSMEGLYFESSLTTPFHFIAAGEMAESPSNPVPGLTYHNFDMERGVQHMEMYGVRYYVSYNEAAASKADTIPELTRVAESPPFVVFELADPQMVVPASIQTVVYDAPDGGVTGKVLGLVGAGSNGPTFNDLALEWYDDLELSDQWVVSHGPEDWPRIQSLEELEASPIPGVSPDAVTNTVVDDHSISFDTTAVGVPHLVRVSYFPNWVAEGADGPYHSTPSLMVVVPTQEHVVLEFRRMSAEWIGIGLTVVALIGLVGLVAIRRRGVGGSSTNP